MTFEEEFLQIVVREQANQRNREIFRAFLGLGSRQNEKFQAIAKRTGLTRVRVRQICLGQQFATGREPPFAPVLDAVLQRIGSRVPCAAAELEAELAAQGTLEAGTTIDGLVRAAWLLKREPAFAVDRAGEQRFVVPHDCVGWPARILSCAKGLASRFGAVQINSLLAELGSGLPGSHQRLVEVVLAAVNGFRWLDQASGWFWIEGIGPTRLERRIRLVLCLAQSISVYQLDAALRRDYELIGRVPPEPILLEICRRVLGSRVAKEEITVHRCEPLADLMEENELGVIRLLQEQGAVWSVRELERLARRQGVRRAAFRRCVQFSPALVHVARGVYGLIGANVAAWDTE